MSMISEAASKASEMPSEGFDVIGAIEDLQSTCERLTGQIDNLIKVNNKLGSTVTNLTKHYTQDFIDTKQGEADRINTEILNQLRQIQEACNGLSVEDMNGLKKQLKQMSKSTMEATDHHMTKTLERAERSLKEIEDRHYKAVNNAFKRVFGGWVLIILYIVVVIGLAIAAEEYFLHGLEKLFASEEACIVFAVILLGVFLWAFIHIVRHWRPKS